MKTRIKELRKLKELTQEDLARLVQVRRETIVYLEKGKYNPSLILAKKVSLALGVDINEVFTFEEGDLE